MIDIINQIYQTIVNVFAFLINIITSAVASIGIFISGITDLSALSGYMPQFIGIALTFFLASAIFRVILDIV